MTAPTLQPGHLFAGKYQVRALLGHGGATATYHAQMQGRDVALKIYSPQLGGRGDVLESLRIAAATTNALPPELTAPILESGFDTQTAAPYSVTDLLAVEQPLSQLVEPRRLSVPEASLVLRGIAQITDLAHRMRLCHLGLKPRNVFVGPAPRYTVRVTDFGVAVARLALPTREGMAASHPWAAPEQVMQSVQPGPAADVFSSALVTFFAMTGRSYWRACQGAQADLSQLQWEIQAARAPVSMRAQEMGTQLPAMLDPVFARALAGTPEERFASVGEFAEALAASLAGPPQQQAAPNPKPNLAMTMPLDAAMLQRPAAPRPKAPSSPVMRPGGAPPPVPQAAPPPLPQQAPGGTVIQQGLSGGPPPPWQPQGPGGAPRVGSGIRTDPETGLPNFSSLDDTDASEQTMSAVMESPLEAFQAEAAAHGYPPQGPQQHMPPAPFPQMPSQGPPGQQLPPMPQQPLTHPPGPMQLQGAVPATEATVLVQRKKNKAIIIGIVAFVVVAGGGGALAAILISSSETPTTPVATGPSASTSQGASTATTAGHTATAPATTTTATAPATTTTATAPEPQATVDAGTTAVAKDAEAPVVEENAEVTITCTPTCEGIKLDDKPLDSWSDPISLPAGQHILVASKPSYVTQTRYLRLKGGQKEPVRFFLAMPGPVHVPCPKFSTKCK